MTLEIDAIDPQGHFSDHNIFANLTLHLDYGPQHVPLSPLPYFGASVVLHVLERAIVLDQTLYRADSQWIYPHFSGMAKRTSRQSSAQKAYSALQEQLYITVRDIRTTVPMHVAFLATLQMPSRRNFELLVLLSILVGAMGWTAGMLHPGRSGSSAKTSCEFRVHPWSSQALSFWIKRRGRPVEGKTKHGRHPAVRADTKEVPEKPKKVETSESAKTMKKLELAIMVHHSPTEFAKKTAVTRASTLHNMSSPQLARYFNERGGKMSGKRVGTM